MSMIFYLVQTNFIDFAIVIFLYIFLLTNNSMSQKINRVFFFVAVVINILIIADSTDYYLAQGNVPHTLRYITSATGYAFRPAPIMLFAAILKRDEKKTYSVLLPMLILNAILAYTSIFTRWMFWFDEQNQFHRGSVGALPFIISGIYLICLLYWSIKRYRLGHKKESSIVVFIIAMSALASGMETLFHFKFIINGVGAISSVFYYLFLHTQTYKRDALTQTLNRHSFYLDSEQYMKTPTIIVSIDINNLKTINDTGGHAAGDLAIVTVANTLEKIFSNCGRLYRTGGDEFILLCPKETKENVSDLLRHVEKELDKMSYQIAWGLVSYNPSMNFEKALSESDANMYQNKQEKKKHLLQS
ncbi:MAG: GGDEF domain-containing protein [Clostridiales bacterium]|nr:GGDEF domain-containing protein [Clostridiales bacterium]